MAAFTPIRITIAIIVMALAATALPRRTTAAPADDAAIDWDRARALHRREQGGEKLCPEEQAYLDRAKAARQARPGPGRRNQQAGQPQRPQAAQPPREFTGLVPLWQRSDQKYKGHDLGLYFEAQNQPPAQHLQRAMQAAARVGPLDSEGKPDPQHGRYVLMSIGMSNTTQEFSRFVEIANKDSAKSHSLVIVDAAQGGQDAADWAAASSQRGARVWQTAEQRLKAANVNAKQVQVLWIKQALKGPQRLGAFPRHAQELQKHLASIVILAKERFPNLQLVYLSSRTYAGWATTALNPEPYAYESAYSVRWLIQSQITGKNAELAYDKAPVLLWGPYLWTDGTKGRDQDTLVWEKRDTAADGTHPSQSGREKIAQLLLSFFNTDPTAAPWFKAATKPK
jgi:hypothetical protein